jgi:lysophospholipase L1-like esterase
MTRVCMLLLGAVVLSAAALAVEPVFVINKGHGGYSTADGLKKWEKNVIEVKPDHLILYYGMNDAMNSRKLIPVAKSRANLEQMISRAQKAGVKSIVLVTLNPIHPEEVAKRHPKHPMKADLSAHLETYNVMIRDLAKAHKFPVADLNDYVKKNGVAKFVRGKHDGVHLNANGYRAFANLFEPIFKGRIKPGETVLCMGDSITYGAGMKGQGTITGDTYPAWLSVHLNRMAGVRDLKRPPPPKTYKESVLNGDFERAADRVHADHWQLWNHPNRFEGVLTLSTDQGAKSGTRHIKVVNANPKAFANLLSLQLKRVKSGKELELVYWTRGTGTTRPVIVEYGKGNKMVRSFPDHRKNPWREGGKEWTRQALAFTVSEKALTLRITMRIAGTVEIDGVTLGKPEAVALLPAPAGEKALTLANAHISLRLNQPQDGGAIASIKNSAGFQFLRAQGKLPLWKLELRRIPTGPVPKGDARLSLDPEQQEAANAEGDDKEALIITSLAKAKTSVDQRDSALILKWEGLDVGEEKGVLDVSVSVRLDKDDPFARFRAAFSNRSKVYTAFYFNAPIVQNIYPQDGKTNLDWLATPAFCGRLVRDPITNGILNKQRRLQPNRSGHSMQFDAYYHEGNGLYLGCFDGEQNLKRYLMETDPDTGLNWNVAHVPNNMKRVPQTWATPYDTVVRCFQGDWYDAARIYRKWALRQTWTREGPIATRASIPQWFKDLDEMWLWNMRKDASLLYDKRILGADKMKGLNHAVGVTYWGKGAYFHGMNPDRFPMPKDQSPYFALAKKNGFRYTGYLQGVLWDTDSPQFKAYNGIDNTVRNFYGQPLQWYFAKTPKERSLIAQPGQVWGNALSATINKMASEVGFSGVYLDSNNHAGTYMNFNPLYGADSGGGNTYIKGNQRMMRQMKARVRQINPDMIFTAESFWEGNMAELDGYLAVNTTHRYLHRTNAFAIPLAHAVYHDHAILYALWMGRHDLQEDGGKGYIAKCAQAFVWGVKPGWEQPTFLTTFRNHEMANPFSVKRHKAYSVSKKFLLYGEMLRMPKLVKDVPAMDLRWGRAWSKNYYEITLPTILRSAWRAPDGSLGIAIYNIGDKAQEAVLDLSDAGYKLEDGKQYTFKAIYPAYPAGNTPAQVAVIDGKLVLRCAVDARSPMVLEIGE